LMLCGSKRRRSKAEITEAREEERLRLEGVNRQANEIAALQQQLLQVQEQNRENNGAADILHRWHEEGRVRQGDGGLEIIGGSHPQQQEGSEPQADPGQPLNVPQVPAGYVPQHARGQRQRNARNANEDPDEAEMD
jgi:hypothetical protein